MISSKCERIESEEFDQWLSYAELNHASALQILAWLKPIVVSLSHRAEEARVTLGEDYGLIPDQGLNPLTWIVNGFDVKSLRNQNGWERGPRKRPSATEAKAATVKEMLKANWNRYANEAAVQTNDPRSIQADEVRKVMTEPANGTKPPSPRSRKKGGVKGPAKRPPNPPNQNRKPKKGGEK